MNHSSTQTPCGVSRAGLLTCLALLLGLLSLVIAGCGGGSSNAPTITTQPTSQSTALGSSASFNVVAVGTGPLTYQWYKGGAAINGATGTTYNIPSVSAANTGNYFVRVSNGQGTANSNTVSLTIPGAPTITTQPLSLSVNGGAPANFNVGATGNGALSYQWYRNNIALSGANGANLSVSAADTIDSGSYYVVVSNASGTATSNLVTLNVNGSALGSPSITTQPSSVTVNSGMLATFTVAATGDGPLTYQWFQGGVTVAGGTGATLSIPSASSANIGSYYVIVTNASGTATSVPVSLTVL